MGFRPFVWNRAQRLGLVGWVSNDSTGVTIEIQGNPKRIDDFMANFTDEVPPLASIDHLSITTIKLEDNSCFEIRVSSVIDAESTPISPDISICNECLAELKNESDRRFLYPFLNCTNCGPRFTIVQDIPYDRPATTMKSFPMCAECQQEYDDRADRRFHAQPNACAVCGPAVWWLASDASEEQFEWPPENANSQQAILHFHAAIDAGDIVAIKGIGGFHLACDATNDSAVKKLRTRKGRSDKPFAILVRDIEQAQSLGDFGIAEQRLLQSKERPIVLVRKHSKSNEESRLVLDRVAPGNSFVGLLLPYSPLHHLIARDKPLVLTSGNLSDEPIVRCNDEARIRLKALADSFLLHNRDIHVVCDDSVVRVTGIGEHLLPIRRSRGFTPMPIRLTGSGPSVLAVGGEIKSAFCVTKHDYAYMSQHIGDMGNAETLAAMTHNVDHFTKIFRAAPQAIVADSHPGYLSGEWAGRLAKQFNVPFIQVQHHFAHVVALHSEQQLPPDKKIIGCCFDGTGYGTDQAIWGGEFLVADGVSFERVGQVDYFPLPGGDASIRKPYRIALSLLWAAGCDWDDQLACVQACPPAERSILRQQLEKNINCVSTSSMGRMFDAVSSLIGIRHEVNYEAQAAMELEAIAASEIKNAHRNVTYDFIIEHTDRIVIKIERLIEQILDDLGRKVDPAIIAAKFHIAVGRMIVKVCSLVRSASGIGQVGLTGGVFQNVLLLEMARTMLAEAGFEVFAHSVVPPNDGGLAFGQAMIARNQIVRGDYS